jgi:hypothetical protein
MNTLTALDPAAFYGQPTRASDFEPPARGPREEVSLSADGQKELERAPEAHHTEAYPEVAVCPDCGLTNCGCAARLEIQKRLDENRLVPRAETSFQSPLMH